MRKKVVAVLLAGALTFGMTSSAIFAAEEPVAEAAEFSGEAVSSEESTDAPAENIEEPTETPVEQPTEAPVEQPTEAPAEQPTEAPAAPTEAPAEQPTEAPAVPTEAPVEQPTEAPAAPTETPQQTETHTEEGRASLADGETEAAMPFMVGEQAYATLAEAIAAATADGAATTEITVSADFAINETVKIPANKSVTIKASTNVILERAEASDSAFTGNMFEVEGTLILSAAEGASLTLDGALESGEAVDGNLVNVKDNGSVEINKDVTLQNNDTYTDNIDASEVKGGAVYSAAAGTVKLYGGSVTGNTADQGAAIYSEGKVYIKGKPSVTENKDGSDQAANIYLASEAAVLVVEDTLEEGAALPVSKADAKEGTVIAEKGDAASQEAFDGALKLFTYEGTGFKIGTDGKLAAEVTPTPTSPATPTPTSPATPTPTPSGAFLGYDSDRDKDKRWEWIDHNSASVYCVTTQNCHYYAVAFPGSVTDDEIKKMKWDDSKTATYTTANKKFRVDVKGIPEGEAKIVVFAKNDKGQVNRLRVKLNETNRPASVASPTPSTRPPYTPSVSESKITGLEKPLKFYPNTFYEFKVTGAGTDNTSPVAGDVKWEPEYWSTASNPTSTQKHYEWQIGAKTGISTAKTYPLYVWFRKYTHDGSNWVRTDVVQAKSTTFSSAAIEITTSITPSVTGGAGGYGSGYGGGTDMDSGDDVQYRTADGSVTGATTNRNAASTADESPVGTMLMLAAVSILAAGFVFVRRRRNTAE